MKAVPLMPAAAGAKTAPAPARPAGMKPKPPARPQPVDWFTEALNKSRAN
jgi:hypothetical protein